MTEINRPGVCTGQDNSLYYDTEKNHAQKNFIRNVPSFGPDARR
ncbi:protein of unknown function [Maridesulfovibrio hydrothermalis AM13 = DSM 14728]|uniref:Uncharacterized protein n=1 Tax=Maridesulfovibrio hydrothermalis AM13 = DSM 14728 TaxID=1121451 RepID=L0RAF2_9BACT|nr:protein of unknown function [Maridesulfovibrio hydrothermalis AM13 = DSM 14728]